MGMTKWALFERGKKKKREEVFGTCFIQIQSNSVITKDELTFGRYKRVLAILKFDISDYENKKVIQKLNY